MMKASNLSLCVSPNLSQCHETVKSVVSVYPHKILLVAAIYLDSDKESDNIFCRDGPGSSDFSSAGNRDEFK